MKKIIDHLKGAPQATTCHRRRGFLRGAGAAAAGLLAAPAVAAALPVAEARSLSFVQTHTGEKLKATYWEHGRYLDDALEEINHVLRDHRTGEIMTMDRGLLDLLHLVRARLGKATPFHVISGYRSPTTNALLRSKSGGVAKRSLHMQGRAIDVRLPGVELKMLRAAAVDVRGGGVGYYARSAFVHLDTGRVRYW